MSSWYDTSNCQCSWFSIPPHRLAKFFRNHLPAQDVIPNLTCHPTVPFRLIDHHTDCLQSRPLGYLAKSPPVCLGLHLRIWHGFGPHFLFHFPVSPSFFYLLYCSPTGGFSLCWHRGFHLKPKGIAGRFKPLVEPTIGIMGRLAEANGIGSLSLHRHRTHRRGGQEVDEVFS